MGKIIKPYVADCRIGKEMHYNLEVVDENTYSIWLRLPDGHIIKKNKFRNNIKPKFISVTLKKDEQIGGIIERPNRVK